MSRRELLLGGAAVGAGALLAGCTSNDTKDGDAGDQHQANAAGRRQRRPGKAVTIGFSAPAADHGWIAAITANAKAQAAKYSDVTLKAVDAGQRRSRADRRGGDPDRQEARRASCCCRTTASSSPQIGRKARRPASRSSTSTASSPTRRAYRT